MECRIFRLAAALLALSVPFVAGAQDAPGKSRVTATADVSAPRSVSGLGYQRGPRPDSVMAGGSFGNLPSWNGTVPSPCEINPSLAGCGGAEPPESPPPVVLPPPKGPAPAPGGDGGGSGDGSGGGPVPSGGGDGSGGVIPAPAFSLAGFCSLSSGGAPSQLSEQGAGFCMQYGYYAVLPPGGMDVVSAWFSVEIDSAAPASEFSIQWTGACVGNAQNCIADPAYHPVDDPSGISLLAAALVTHAPSGASKTVSVRALWAVCGNINSTCR